MAKRGAHAAQAHAAGTAMGVGIDIVQRWNFVQVVYGGSQVSAANASSKLMLASSRAGEFSTGSLFDLTHCASCSILACLHSSQSSAKGQNSQKQDM